MFEISVKGVNSINGLTCLWMRLRDRLINCLLGEIERRQTSKNYSNFDRCRSMRATVQTAIAYLSSQCSLRRDKSQSACWCHCQASEHRAFFREGIRVGGAFMDDSVQV